MRAEDLEADLDAFVVGDELPPDEPPPVPEDAHGASRLLLAVRMREREIERVTELAKERIDRVTTWRDDRAAGARRSIEHISRSLEFWMRSHHERTGQVTTNLPDGELRVRPGSPSLAVYDDRAAMIAFRVAGRWGWIRTKFEVAKDAVKAGTKAGTAIEDRKILDRLGELPATHEWRAVVDENGEILPGLAIAEPVERVFGYTTKKPKKPQQQKMEEVR